jgi:uncharacterized protein YbjT (DUF2867 family)
VEGDLTRPESLAGAMEGVEGLHLINFSGDDYYTVKKVFRHFD